LRTRMIAGSWENVFVTHLKSRARRTPTSYVQCHARQPEAIRDQLGYHLMNTPYSNAKRREGMSTVGCARKKSNTDARDNIMKVPNEKLMYTSVWTGCVSAS
jgi:hypothetical protein